MNKGGKGSAPLVVECNYCHKQIMFDGFVRSPKGTLIPLDLNYRFHHCTGPFLSAEQLDINMINQASIIAGKLNQGLYRYTIKLVVETKEPRFTQPASKEREQEKPLTLEQQLLLNSRK